MPIFKKTASDTGRLSESHRKVLQRNRFRLVKEIDVATIFDYLPADEGFKSDIKEQILSFPSKEERNGALLDRLETRGDRAFNLFMEALHEKYKHIAFTLESHLHSMDDGESSDHEEVSAVQGDAVRRILLKSQKKDPYQCSESVDDLDDICYEKDTGDYVSCYTVPVRGKLQRDTWIKEIKEPLEEQEDTETTFMGRLIRNLVFKEVTPEEIPKGVRQPLGNVKAFVIEENEALADLKIQESYYPKQYIRSNFQNTTKLGNHRHAKDPLPPKPKKVTPPPPVPPKSLAIQPMEVTIPESQDCEESPKPPPPRKSESPPQVESPKIPTPPPPPKRTEDKESSSSPEPNAPPVPPRISSAGPKSSLSKPPPPKQEEGKTEKPLPVVAVQEEVEEEEEASDDELMGKEIPAPDTEEDGSVHTVVDNGLKNTEDEDYEAIGAAEDLMTKRDSSEITENDSGIINTPKEGLVDSNSLTRTGSRSATPASLGRLSSTESDPDSVLQKAVMGGARNLPRPLPNIHMATKQWCDVSVLPNKHDSSDGDSYYEDIDALDAVKTHRNSNAYLHPRSVGRSLDRRQNSVASSLQTSTLRTMLGIYVELQKDDLLVVELEDTLDEEAMKTAIENQIRVREPSPEHFALPSSVPTSPCIERIPEQPEPEIENEITESSSTEDACMSPRPINVLKTVAALENTVKEKLDSPPSPRSPRASFLVKEKKDIKCLSKATQYEEKEEATHCASTCTMTSYSAFQDTCLCYDKLGRGFYIKKEFIKHFNDPSEEPWFYPVPITSQQATLFLRSSDQKGCFLVYKTPKSSPQCLYNLSLCNGNGDVLHYHIVQNSHRDFMIEGHDHSFMNVQELVAYFKSNKSQLATRLRRPLKEVDMPISPGYHYDIQYELKRKDIALNSNIIGRGNFGVVCSGSYQHDIAVAVKVLQSGGDDHTQEEDAFVEESCTMMGLKHDHIIQLIGVSCSARPFFLVTEYIPNGSLRKCLNNATIPSDHIDILFDICLQATSAMCYLESRRYLLHRDLAARNILVTSDTCIKLADFGRARLVADDNYQAERTEPIAIKWASTEVLKQSTYSTKSDVWALGVLYWEILSGGELPYATMSNEQAATYIVEGGRLEKPPGCSRDLFRVMKQCWSEQPTDRPTFAALYDMLKSKSSIYYSSETMPRSKTPASKRSDSMKHNNKTPLTPSAIKKLRHKSESGQNKVSRRSTLSAEQKIVMDKSTRKSCEMLPTSSSEASLNSTLVTDKDDLTRGHKIRKSLRKMVSMKPKKSGAMKNSLNGTPEQETYQETYN